MLIPRYWAQVDGTATTPDGREYALRMWGCSPDSDADAQADAQRRYDGARRRIEEGRLDDDHARARSAHDHRADGLDSHGDPRVYTYGRSLLREELLEEISGARGGTVAIRTRNRYGAQILNAASALFLDVDLAPDSLGGRLMAMLRGKPASIEARTLDRLRRALESARGAWGDASFRIYRTAAGLRVMETARVHEPGSPPVLELMRAAGTDRAFVMLCGVQKCFRARLTPKPWRIEQPKPPTSFPFASAADEARMRRWQQAYEAASSGFAVCRLIEQIGTPRVHADLARTLEIHDRLTRATADLPLA